MRRVKTGSCVGAAFAAILVAATGGWTAGASAEDTAVIYADQGAKWTKEARGDFYVEDQGSEMIPLSWMRALNLPDRTPFLADSLSRYGYLPNKAANNPENLPVGFTVATPSDSTNGPMLGMTCSACHTREITAEGKTYRIDGGPGIVDFQSLLADLDKAVLGVLANDAAFLPFAQAVLGTPTPDPSAVAVLRADVALWSVRYHVLMVKALPFDHPWGPARLDAVSMIFNRLTGLDIGPKPTYLIPGNIRLADAPTRYPFLWNAPVQSNTQWPAFADNGSDLLGLARNLGEVYGVFGTFHPQKPWLPFPPINLEYDKENSANYDGLSKLETLIGQIGPPKWPWSTNPDLVKRGEAVFNRPGKDGCVDCHGQKRGPNRYGINAPFVYPTWATPSSAGTDTHEWDVLNRTAETGSMENAFIPLLTKPLCKTDTAFNILATAVIGGIVQHYVPVAFDSLTQVQLQGQAPALPGAAPTPTALPPMQGVDLRFTSLGSPQMLDLRGAFARLETPACTALPPTYVYESRVLYGIWAAAPYLHNGSVPTLADLLKPPGQRTKSFRVGPAYDTTNIGLAADQTKFDYTYVTTDCAHLSSGNSNCGHDYGTSLSDADKNALLEYLKVIGPPGAT